jgi:glycosyltransferase involved in cell wall biosynthesis
MVWCAAVILCADGSYLRWQRGGLSRYLDGLLHGIERLLDGGEELVVYYNSRGGPRLFGARTRERDMRVQTATLWNQVRVPLALRADRCDVYLGGANIVPVAGRCAKVVVVHDALAFRDPDTKRPHVTRYLRRWQPRSARAATRLVAISQAAAADCEAFLGVPRTRIEVVPQGVDPRFTPGSDADRRAARERLDRLGVPPRYVLQVAAHEPHKGGAVAAAAVERLRTDGLDVALVQCGGSGRSAATSGSVALGYVAEETLLDLYRSAAAVCVSSTHEGFGLPVVEAMACGAPVVAARAGGLPEAGGEAALYADAGDVPAFAAALRRLLGDEAESEARRQAGLERAAGMGWDAAAARVLAVVRDAAQESSTRRRPSQ